MLNGEYVAWLEELRIADIESVGGKNASLGEMLGALSASGIRVPGGFATTSVAYREFLEATGLDQRIEARLKGLDTTDVEALARCGAEIRSWIEDTPLPAAIESAIRARYRALVSRTGNTASFAVRSSATAEDLPDASFAGQQETFLNIRGEDNVIHAVRRVFASLYNDRAISYRVHQGFDHTRVALSAAVQQMVRSDAGAAGVMFTLDTESGFRDAVFITSSYGLGELVVQGAVNPDEFYVHKPMLAAGYPAVISRKLGSKLEKMVFAQSVSAGKSVMIAPVAKDERRAFSLTDGEVLELAKCAVAIETHYGRPMDIEWGKDGIDGKLYVLQARPETVKSRKAAACGERHVLKSGGTVLVSGRAVGQKIGKGTVRVVADASQMSVVRKGDVLVTDMTDPNWEPVMKLASAIVTNRGGRTCHAAIIARELGIPAVVGCGDATDRLETGAAVTVSCAEGNTGNVYAGLLESEVHAAPVVDLPEIPTKIAMNIGNPDLAFEFSRLPNAGVGLARLEFIINNMIGIHPRACIEHSDLPADLAQQVSDASSGYASPTGFYREKIVEGVATIAAAFWPKPVIVRLSDFKSNEYRKLVGGALYEPEEENPMLGFRGASRYVSPAFRDCFRLECEALRKVRDDLGFTNVEVMVPFVRTLEECRRTIDLLAEFGLQRGNNGLRLIMMCEVPSNAILAEEFLRHFDGFSIGSNDLTQLSLGVDRDSGLVAASFDEQDPAVRALLRMAIGACRRFGKYVGICGQGPSDNPDFALWLADEGIASLSLNPDTVIQTWSTLADRLQSRRQPHHAAAA